jgi:EAL and modified HD-GYP domain-containing signal transduction protein
MKEVAYRIKRNAHFADMAYITGMLSIDEIMFHESYTKLLEQITVDKNIINALLHKEGVLGRLLELAIAIEKNNLVVINSMILKLDISERELNESLLESYQRSSAALKTEKSLC